MIIVHRADAVLEMDIPERNDVVIGLLPRGDAVLFSAREKAGKGLIMLDLAACVTAGEPFLGREVMQGPVIYLALEEGRRTIRDRIDARFGKPDELPFFVGFLDGSDGQTFRLEGEDSIQGLQDLIIEYQPLIVVLDVLREAHDGRENESDDMAVLLRPIRQLAHQHNVTIVVTHHISKAGAARGSTSIPAAFDDTMEFVREDLDADTQMRGLLTARGRDLPKVSQHIQFDPMTFRWFPIEDMPLARQPANIGEKIFAVVNTTDEWLTAEELTEKIGGVKLRTVQNKLAELTRERSSQLLVEGTGTRGDPKRYRGIHRLNDGITSGGGNVPGDISRPSESPFLMAVSDARNDLGRADVRAP